MRLCFEEIHLYQQLAFPGLVFEPEPQDAELLLATEEGREKMERARGMLRALQPFEEEIARFFHPSFSLPEALFSLEPLEGQDAFAWLERAMSHDEEALRLAMLKEAMPQISEDRLLLFAQNPATWQELLNRSQIPHGARWLLLGLLEDPKASLQDLGALYRKLRILSDALAAPVEMEAWQALKDALPLDGERFGHFLPLPLEDSEIMPSILPWPCRRVGHSGQMILMGYALPELLLAMEKEQEERRRQNLAFCQSLADPTRYRLCCLLAEGPMLQKDLSERLGVSQATVSHHLSQLRKSGILGGEKGMELDCGPILEALNGMARDLKVS